MSCQINNTTVILADGEFPASFRTLEILKNAARIVCCDGSAASLLSYGLEPDWIVGDLDSLSDDLKRRYADKLVLIDEQESNDLSKTFHFCVGRGWDSIVILGATGKREDHTIGNLSLLGDYARIQPSVRIVTDYGEFSVVQESGEIASYAGEKLSIIALDGETAVTSMNLKYPMNSLKLNMWWQATLNESLGDMFRLDFPEGKRLLLFREHRPMPRSCIGVPKIEDDGYDWWARHQLKVRSAQEDRYDLVFIGDSITHFWSTEDNINFGEGHYDETFGHIKNLNLGYGFDRTQNVLWRLEHGELANQKPEMIVLNIGTNQFSVSPRYNGDTPEVAAAGIIAVVEKLHIMCPETKIVLMALFPRRGKESDMDGVNAILREKAASLPIAALVDLTGELGDSDHTPIPEYYKGDGTHLARPGYEIWGKAILPYVEKYCK